MYLVLFLELKSFTFSRWNNKQLEMENLNLNMEIDEIDSILNSSYEQVIDEIEVIVNNKNSIEFISESPMDINEDDALLNLSYDKVIVQIESSEIDNEHRK